METAKRYNCGIADQSGGQLRDLAGRLLQSQLGFFKLHIELARLHIQFNLGLLQLRLGLPKTTLRFCNVDLNLSGFHFGFAEILIIRGTCLPRERQ
jgi:hypothetical protein